MITQAICWTLLHSLWQGALAALAAGIIIGCTRRSRAALRYNLLAADVLLFLLFAVVTFVWSLAGGSAARLDAGGVIGGGMGLTGSGAGGAGLIGGGAGLVGDGAGLAKTLAGVGAPAGGVGIGAAAENVLREIGIFLNHYALTIVLVWLACMAVQLMRLTGGLYHIYRIRRRSTLPVAGEWEQRLGLLAARMGIGRRVRLFQTAAIGMPAVAGILKPVILVPLGMLAQLPPEQVETIFLHELAHIRRRDYLMNLLLHVSEAIFFFNPGVRWVVALLRQEREACCDDAVLAETEDQHLYFDALVGFMQFTIGRQELAMPLLGKGKTELLWRVRRMLTRENKKLHIMEKTVLSFGLMALVAAGLISMREPQQAPVKVEPRSAGVGGGAPRGTELGAPVKDTAPITYSPLDISIHDDGHGRIVKATATDNKGNTYVLKEVDDKVVEFSINGREIKKEDYNRYVDLFDQIEDCADTPPVPPVPPIDPIPPVPPIDPIPPVPPIPELASVPPVDPIAPIPPVSPVAPVPPVPPVPPNDYYVRHIIRDLRSDNIVTETNPLRFTLDNDGFSVNGVRQPEEVFKRYKAKYLDRPSDHFIYDHHGGTTHTDISTDKKAPEEI